MRADEDVIAEQDRLVSGDGRGAQDRVLADDRGLTDLDAGGFGVEDGAVHDACARADAHVADQGGRRGDVGGGVDPRGVAAVLDLDHERILVRPDCGRWRVSDVASAGACGPQDEGRGSVGGREESLGARGVEAESRALDEFGEQGRRVVVGGGAQAGLIGERVVDGVGVAGLRAGGGSVVVAVAEGVEVVPVVAGFDEGEWGVRA